MPIRTRPRNKEPVLLNVYDLSPMNDLIYPMGIGIYHSGVVVHGSEYTFGESGVFSHPPQQLEGIALRESIPVAGTKSIILEKKWNHANVNLAFYLIRGKNVGTEVQLSSQDVQRMVDDMKNEWSGDTYDAITRNCNHFSEAFVQRLAGVEIPGYVNRLAYVGSAVSCLIPKDQRRGAPVDDNSQPGQPGGNSSGFTVIAPPGRTASSTGTSREAASQEAPETRSSSSWFSSFLPANNTSTENTGTTSGAPLNDEPPSQRREKMLQAAVQRRQQQQPGESS